MKTWASKHLYFPSVGLEIVIFLFSVTTKKRTCHYKYPVGWYVGCRDAVSVLDEYVRMVLREVRGKCAKSGW
jgi:hypothetical protein